jgi:uncharacterized protein (TIGR02118 family)
MVPVSVLYPKSADSPLDHDYYMQTHIPLVRARWQAMGLVSDSILRGVSTLDGQPPAYELIGILTFDSVENVQAALAAHGAEIIGDIPNFTNVSPLIQLNSPAS